MTAYDICFRPAGSWWRSWWRKDYYKMTVDSPATSVLITRENGLNPLTTYDFEVRARNDHGEGEWNKGFKYIGAFIQCMYGKCDGQGSLQLIGRVLASLEK